MYRQSRKSLATRQTKTVFLVAVALGLLFSFYQIVLDLHRERQKISEKYHLKLEQNYTNASQAAYHVNPLLAQQVTDSIMTDKAVRHVVLTDDFNDVLSEERRTFHYESRLNQSLGQWLFTNEQIYTISLHQPGTTQVVGTLSFTVNGIASANGFLERAKSLLIFDMIRNVLLASILLFFFYRKLSKPLIDLTYWVRSLQFQESQKKLPGQLRDDELGQLAQSFQTMWNEREQASAQLSQNIEALEKSEHFASTIMDNSSDALLLINQDGKITHVNSNTCDLLGYEKEELVGFPAVTISVSYSIDYIGFKVKQPSESQASLFEAVHRKKNGATFPVEATAIELTMNDTPMFLVQARDISNRKQAEIQIHNLAYFDGLTGLPNRKQLLDRLDEALNKSYRTSEPGVLLYLDLDRFKTINDSLGHAIGDQLLQAVSERLQQLLDPIHLFARIGGDEFAILMPNVPLDQAKKHAEEVLSLARSPYVVESHHLYCSISVGIATFPSPDTNALELLRQADTALYRAKSAGSNTYKTYEPEMRKLVDSFLSIEKGLHEALNKNQFELYYQPQVNKKGELVGAEALIRWNHPTQGTVPPDTFMSIAEETGQIIPMGSWILEQACLQMAHWKESGNVPSTFKRLAINISPLQFSQADFVEQVTGAVERSGIAPEDIELELTENMLLKNIDACVIKMAELKKKGFKIAIDDFGTGYSSLKYLKRLSLDVLKIDRSFVTELHLNKNDTAIVDSIILMSERLGLEVIAEGVEEPEELKALTDLGCEQFQGYIFDKPLDAETMSLRLKKPQYNNQIIKQLSQSK
ncbi:c-di-GMP phosphodiesterase [Vibrio sp. vnigr-6D03]|uniref:EAL domain-containing protein n=1 Tax=Vibrio sp. vnigr-6D03 TaxID=2058088 RepID=UPI000C33D5AB|nr:EAL domain-containing protein [Vibrio sp. vnigr-6D03]PKF78531.1 c-di-GMP phosphodiesterase [Vibrio sp. vnigr-6D03]